MTETQSNTEESPVASWRRRTFVEALYDGSRHLYQVTVAPSAATAVAEFNAALAAFELAAGARPDNCTDGRPWQRLLGGMRSNLPRFRTPGLFTHSNVVAYACLHMPRYLEAVLRSIPEDPQW